MGWLKVSSSPTVPVPKPASAVVGARSEQTGVGGEGKLVDGACVSLQFLLGPQIARPKDQDRRTSSHGQHLPIRRSGQTAEGSAIASSLEKSLPRCHVPYRKTVS